ncbi:3436_t:CDS:2 [Ambispora leptoticha]|uniref:3436_t:CDS:1 n=1 Tax=Ambispora leptoticha TaxID=144679 RepID=A0A9N8VBA1_9GLOM|nr:3436_t:CDS:2 [Ambispora leptoticha]
MNWSIENVTRGAQLAWQGSMLAFENRHLYKHSYVKVFLWLCSFSLILYILSVTVLAIPFQILRLIIYLLSLIFRYDPHKVTIDYNHFLTNWVFNLPFLGLLFMRYIYPQPLDSLFLESLRQIDIVYLRKHQGEQELRPPYASALERYDLDINYWAEMRAYMMRTFRDLRWTALLYLASLIPLVGRLIYPAASAYALVNSLGLYPATTVGVLMYITPGTKKFAILFLETLFSSRTLMRELLEPYFARIPFSREKRKKWFRERETILFGFSIAFYPFIRLPLVGMLFFGVAQAAAALLLVKTTEPPPPPGLEMEYVDDIKYKDNRLQKRQHKQE